MLLLTVLLKVESLISYYFKFHLHSLCLLLTVLPCCLIKKRQTHNSLSHILISV